jgi:CheY-like chemotaxis protein
MNLCVNAVDAMPDNASLTLRTRNVDNDWIEVEVEDTGSGMSQEILAKALDPFFTTKGEGKGTGLGLSLVYSTVKAHRGSMTIKSAPGEGTCVKIRFPACPPMPEVSDLEDARRALPATPAMRVLVVDDDELVMSSTRILLELLGHMVTGVASGEEALERLASGLVPAVVLLDMNMPGLGGAETLARLRLLHPDLPVLLSTGRVDQTALDLVGAHPNVTLLAKPFSMRELQAQFKVLEKKERPSK